MRLMPKLITSRLTSYIWQHPAWPALTFDVAALTQDLSNARLEQGKLLGLLHAIGIASGQEIARELWVQEAMSRRAWLAAARGATSALTAAA